MRRIRIAVGVLSGAALAYEMLLIRLFSIVEWHHFAFLVISLALLGYGASGTLIAVAGRRLSGRFADAAAAFAFAITSVAAFLIAQRLDFNSLEIFWSARQAAMLVAVYLLFAVPFFCAATAIGLTLVRHGSDAARIYRSDLAGAGSSAVVLTAMLFVVHPVTCLQAIAAAGAAAGGLFGGCRRRVAFAAITAVVAIAAARPLLLPLRLSQFKELPQALRVPGARVIDERSSPLALLTTVASPAVPFRWVPGLSLNFTGELPEQVAIYRDGGAMSVVNRRPSPPGHEDFVPEASVFRLRSPRRVAVIGAGGGAEVAAALARGAGHVTAVEIDPQLVDLVRSRLAAFSGGLYADPRVRVVVAEGRRFMSESRERYDIIEIPLSGAIASSASGTGAMTESFLFTVEAFDELLDRLEPGGWLVVTRWMQVPPRDIVKLFATMAEALERRGTPPESSLAVVRSWNTATLLVKRGAITAEEVAQLRRFCDDRSFDLDYAPGIRREETNRHNVLAGGALFDSATAILRGRDEFFRRYKFHVRPATDERPYFSNFFRLSIIPEVIQLRRKGGMPLIEWGYVVLVAALLQALVASAALILAPLCLLRREAAVPRGRLIVYFGSIGLAFLFLEIAFIQRLTLFLGHPLYAVAVVLAGFLVFAGTGSGLSPLVAQRGWAGLIPFAIAGVALADLLLVRFLTAHALALAAVAKMMIAIAMIAPLALLMGMPFPLGLMRLSQSDRSAIPWAWGINGTASVLSPMLATLMAVHFGVSAVVVAAAVLYVAALSGGRPL